MLDAMTERLLLSPESGDGVAATTTDRRRLPRRSTLWDSLQAAKPRVRRAAPDGGDGDRLGAAAARGGRGALEAGIPCSRPLADGPDSRGATRAGDGRGPRTARALDLTARAPKRSGCQCVALP